MEDLAEQYAGHEMDVTIVHGHCRSGVDSLVDRVARMMGFAVERHPAIWAVHGKAAGPKRNQLMVDYGADMAWAYKPHFDRRLRAGGTEDCVRRALAADIPVWLVDLVRAPGWFAAEVARGKEPR